MINCVKCYHCKLIGNILYCPFFGIQPCYRGEHKINLAELNTKNKAETKVIIVPSSKSVCYAHTERILKAYSNAESILELARELNITKNNISTYANRVLDFNGITIATLRSQKWRLVKR